MPNRPRHHPRCRRRRGRTRPRRANARAMIRRPCRRQPKPRQPSSRAATCCFLRHRGRNASVPRRERPIRPRLMFASLRLPRRRRSNQATPPPVTFDDAWPQSERSRTADTPSQRRSGRAPSTFTEPSAGATGADRYSPVARNEEHPPVTVLKSGVVDGMAYSLYSDGSIEAQMPEGMMRFASIDELRAHLDQRP